MLSFVGVRSFLAPKSSRLSREAVAGVRRLRGMARVLVVFTIRITHQIAIFTPVSLAPLETREVRSAATPAPAQPPARAATGAGSAGVELSLRGEPLFSFRPLLDLLPLDFSFFLVSLFSLRGSACSTAPYLESQNEWPFSIQKHHFPGAILHNLCIFKVGIYIRSKKVRAPLLPCSRAAAQRRV